MVILICTDGSNISKIPAEWVSKFGFPTTTSIVILGVSEIETDVRTLTPSMDLIDKSLST